MTITPADRGPSSATRVLRVEDQELITGAGDYTADLQHEGAYHVAFVRSPIAHGTLTGVDADEARGMPGVRAVYTGDDLGLAPRQGLPGVVPETMARPYLAQGKVRFVGDIVAVVVADTRGAGTGRGRRRDPRHRAAARGDRPRGRARRRRARCCSTSAGTQPGRRRAGRRGRGPLRRRRHVVPRPSATSASPGVPMEPNACLAVPGEPDGGLTLWLATQTPHGAAPRWRATSAWTPSRCG